ncbi:hypothetical protein QQS21_008016 [Conoideocrella luteorostrata]|uniref:Fructose-bisphosphate aldolase n=1 Tax=Conoideocrella luteorostrata TaxID=1105319 RepID=A0AAJ0FRT2_9HYPO|nr:hypothetical protein QQS21_008016 [Conoideocrella luteorostrata]
MARSLQGNKLTQILNHASDNNYAVAATCCYNLEGILATVRAAEAQNSPAIIQLFPWAIEFASGLLVHAAAEACANASVPVGLHMDHAQSPEIIKRAANMGGFDGIMVDMSHYSKEENMSKTRELVQYCHERGIITEAEPGRIEGGEDGVADTADLEAVLTTPEQAEEFLALGIDWLAPAFGNVHGQYGAKGPKLDYERLRRIRETTRGRVHLVLHGANGFDEKLFRECIECGMVKCNINDALNGEWKKVLRERVDAVPLTGLIEEGTLAMQKAIERHMIWMGSAGKASES